MDYLDSLLIRAISNNQLVEFIIGSSYYMEKPSANDDNYSINYKNRLRTICEYSAIDAKTIHKKTEQIILTFLTEEWDRLEIGVLLIKYYIELNEEGLQLKINNKEFFENIKGLLLSRKEELISEKISDPFHNNAWSFVERMNYYSEKFNGKSFL